MFLLLARRRDRSAVRNFAFVTTYQFMLTQHKVGRTRRKRTDTVLLQMDGKSGRARDFGVLKAMAGLACTVFSSSKAFEVLSPMTLPSEAGLVDFRALKLRIPDTPWELMVWYYPY